MQSDKKKQAMENLIRKANVFHRVFSSPDGKKVLEYLDAQFNGAKILERGDPYTTHYNLGSRDVVVYIEEMMRLKENAARAELEGQPSG